MPHQGSDIIHITSEISTIPQPHQWSVLNDEYTISTLLYPKAFKFLRDHYGCYIATLFARLRAEGSCQTPSPTESTYDTVNPVNINYYSAEMTEGPTNLTNLLNVVSTHSTTTDSSGQYCTLDLSDMTKHSNQALCVIGSKDNVLQRFTIKFYEPNPAGTTWQFLFNLDSTYGAVVTIDGNIVTEFIINEQPVHWNDFPQDTWDETLTDPKTKVLWLERGPHELVVMSAETCCDGEVGGWEFNRGHTGWVPITVEALGQIAALDQISAVAEPKMYPTPATFFLGICSLYMLGGVYTDIRSPPPTISLSKLDSDVCLYLCMGETSKSSTGLNREIFYNELESVKYLEDINRSLDSEIWNGYFADSLVWFNDKIPRVKTVETKIEVDPILNGIDYITYKWYGVVTLPKSSMVGGGIVVESAHPYANNFSESGTVHIPEALGLSVIFDPRCYTEPWYDFMEIYARDPSNEAFNIETDLILSIGREELDRDSAGVLISHTTASTALDISGNSLWYKFTSDITITGWGYRFIVIGTPQTDMTGVSDSVVFSLTSDDSSLLFMWPTTNGISSNDISLNSPYLLVDNSGHHSNKTVTGTIDMLVGIPYNILIIYGERRDTSTFNFQYKIGDPSYNTKWITDLTTVGLEFNANHVNQDCLDLTEEVECPGEADTTDTGLSGLNREVFYDLYDSPEYLDDVANSHSDSYPWNGYFDDRLEWFNDKVPEFTDIETTAVRLDAGDIEVIRGVNPGPGSGIGEIIASEYFTVRWYGTVILPESDSRTVVGESVSVEFNTMSDDSSLLFISPTDTDMPPADWLDSEHLIVNNSEVHATESKHGYMNMVVGTEYKILILFGNRWGPYNMKCIYRTGDDWVHDLTGGELEFSTKSIYNTTNTMSCPTTEEIKTFRFNLDGLPYKVIWNPNPQNTLSNRLQIYKSNNLLGEFEISQFTQAMTVINSLINPTISVTSTPCSKTPVCEKNSIFTEFMVYNHKPRSPIILCFIIRFLRSIDYIGGNSYPRIKRDNDFCTWGDTIKYSLYKWLVYNFNGSQLLPEQKYHLNEVKIPIIIHPHISYTTSIKINLFYFPKDVNYTIRYGGLFKLEEAVELCVCNKNTLPGLIKTINIDGTYDIIAQRGDIHRGIEGCDIRRLVDGSFPVAESDDWYSERFSFNIDHNILTVTKIKSDFEWDYPLKIDICLATDEIIYLFKQYPINSDDLYTLEYSTEITPINSASSLPIDIRCKLNNMLKQHCEISHKIINIISQEPPPLTTLVKWEQLNLGYHLVTMVNTQCVCFLQNHFNSYISELFGRITLGSYRDHFMGLCKLYITGGIFSDATGTPFNIANGLISDISVYVSLKSVGHDSISRSMINTSPPKNPLILCFILWFLMTSSFIKRVNPNYGPTICYDCLDTNTLSDSFDSSGARFDIYNCIRYNLDNIIIKPDHRYIITKLKIPIILEPRPGNEHSVNLFYFPDNIGYTCEVNSAVLYEVGDSVEIYIEEIKGWELGTIVSGNFGGSYNVTYRQGIPLYDIRCDYIRDASLTTGQPSNWVDISGANIVIGAGSFYNDARISTTYEDITSLDDAWAKVAELDTGGNPIIMFQLGDSGMKVHRYQFLSEVSEYVTPTNEIHKSARSYVEHTAEYNSATQVPPADLFVVYVRIDYWGELPDLVCNITDNILKVSGPITHPIKIDICIDAYESLYLFEERLNAEVFNTATLDDFTPYTVNSKYVYIYSDEYDQLNTCDSWRSLNPLYTIEYSFSTHCMAFLRQNFNRFMSSLFIRINHDPYRMYLWGLCKLYKTGGTFLTKRLNPMNLNGMWMDNGATFYTILEPVGEHYISAFMLNNSNAPRPLILGFILWFIFTTTRTNGIKNEYDEYNCLRYNLNMDVILNGVVHSLTSVKIPITINESTANSNLINLFYFPSDMEYTIELRPSPLFAEYQSVEVKLPHQENWVSANIIQVNYGGTYDLVYVTSGINIYNIMEIHIQASPEDPDSTVGIPIDITNYIFDIQDNILTITSIDGSGWDTFMVNICLATSVKLCIIKELKYNTRIVLPPVQNSIDYMWSKSIIRNNMIYTLASSSVPKYVRKSWSYLNSGFQVEVSLNDACIQFLQKHTNRYVTSLFQRIRNRQCKEHLWSLCKLFICSGVYSEINSISRLHVNEVDQDITVYLATSPQKLTISTIANNSEPKNPLILWFIISFLRNEAYTTMKHTLYNLYACIRYSLKINALEINKKYPMNHINIPVYIGPSDTPVKTINLFYFPDDIQYSIELDSHIDGAVFDFTIHNSVLRVVRIDVSSGWDYPYKIDICILSSETIYLV